MSRRKRPSMRLKLDVALYQLGLDPRHVRLDHHPPLAMRQKFTNQFGAVTYWPPENHPRYMQFLSTEAHKEKTTGRRGTSKLSKRGGDLSEIAKTKRLEKKRLTPSRLVDMYLDHPLLRKFLTAAHASNPKPKRPWPKRELGHWGGHNPFYADIKAGKPPWPKRKIPSRPKKET